MHTVTLRLRPLRIAAMMTAVRRWLDARGFMATAFHYDTRDDKMLVVKMEFANDDQADAFAGAFKRAAADPPGRRNDRRGFER